MVDLVYAYVYNSTLPLKSPNHLLTTSKKLPKGPLPNAVKQTSRQPRQFRLKVSIADSIRPIKFVQDNFDCASRNAFAVLSSAHELPELSVDLQRWLLVLVYVPIQPLECRRTFA